MCINYQHYSVDNLWVINRH